MNFIYYNLTLLVSALPAVFLFSIGNVACLAPYLFFQEKYSPRKFFSVVKDLISGAFQIYFWGLWAAFCVSVTYKYTTRTDVTLDWIYFLVGFFNSSLIIVSLNSKEQSGDHNKIRKKVQQSSGYYSVIAWIGFLLFSFRPSFITPVYGWATDVLGLTRYINPPKWSENDRECEKRFFSAKKKAEIIWDFFGKIGQPGVAQPDTSLSDLKVLLAQAISEADLVSDEFLTKMYPDYPRQYKNFRQSLQGLSEFLKTKDDQIIVLAFRQYNQYCEWVNANYKKFRLIE